MKLLIGPKFSPSRGINSINDIVPSSDEVLKGILFYDKILFADQRIIGVSNPDIDFLESVGLCERRYFNSPLSVNLSISNGIIGRETIKQMSEVIKNSIFQTLKNENQELALSKNCVDFIKSAYSVKNANYVSFQFIDSLLLPAREVAFQDVFEFKEKRKDAFSLLKNLIKEIDDNNLDESLKEIKKAIVEINSTMNESFVTRIARSASFEFQHDGKRFASLVAGGIGADVYSDFSLAIPSAIALGIASSINIKASAPLLPAKIDQSRLPALYLAEARRDFQ